MLYPSRDLHGPAQSWAVRDLFQSLFVAELIHPSPKLWLFFAWISDVEIIDNSAREFAALEPDWPAAPIGDRDLRFRLANACALRRCLNIIIQVADVLRPFAWRADPAFARQRHRPMLSLHIASPKP